MCPICRFALIAGVALALTATAWAQANVERTPMLRVHLPDEVAPEKATLIFGEYGEGLTMGPRVLQKGKYDYSFSLWDRATSVKVLLYCPGYRMVTAEFSLEGAAPIVSFEPHFDELPKTALCVRMVDSEGSPLAHEPFSLHHDLAPHKYFGYLDGMTHGATIASGTTGADGTCTLLVPSLLDDPYFGKHSFPPDMAFEIRTPRNQRHPDQDLSPATIPVKRAYSQPIIVTVSARAHLHGHVAIPYVRAHQLFGTVTPYTYEDKHGRTGPTRVELRAEVSDGGRSFNCMLLRDGSFSVKLPPGTYDLVLVELGEGGTIRRVVGQTGKNALSEYYRQRVPLDIRVILREGEDKAVNVG